MISLEELINELENNTLIEGPSIEFKRNIPTDLSILAKIIVGMANTEGGYILCGIIENSKGNYIIGIEDKIPFSDKLSQLNKFCDSKYFENGYITVKGKTILYIKVEKAEYPIYFQKNSKSERLYKYVRIGDKTKVLTGIKSSDSESSKLYTKVYKYMNLETFLCSLYNSSIRFSEPSKWPDRFETRFYCANYENIPDNQYARKLYATCVTRTKNNEAAWKVYARNEGLSCHCVQLEIDIVELRNQLRQKDFIIQECKMNYSNEDYILSLHKKESKDYSDYFSPFSAETYLKLLTLKRDAYQYENEIRIFAIPSEQGERNVDPAKATSIDIPLSWDKIIKSVRIDKKCSQAELIAVTQACHFANINPIFKKEIIVNIPTREGEVNINFELYDIDELPDNRPITIE